MIRARGLVTTIALACLLAPLAISTETVAAGTTSTGSDDGSQTGHRDDPGHRTPPAQKAPLQPCRSGHARCGTVRRLLDPTRPNGARIGIGFELYPRQDRSRPSLGTIVAVEGGPGYSTTDSRSYYLDLFEPLLDSAGSCCSSTTAGTGHVRPIRCPQLQSYQGNRNLAIARCGRQLGATSDLYGSRVRRATTWPPCSTSSASTASTCTATPTARSSARRSQLAIPTGCAP